MDQKIQHAALYVHADLDRSWVVEELLKGKIIPGIEDAEAPQVQVFSTNTLQYFIKEELHHDHLEVDTGLNTSLANASSGEQRKSLLRHLLASNPSCIILEDVYESLDIQARQWVLQTLTGIENTIQVIQIFSRKADLLPFMERVYVMEGDVVIQCVHSNEFFTDQQIVPPWNAVAKVPPPLHTYADTNEVLVSMNAVSVSYDGRLVLKDISWEIRSGEFWQLVGPNGSGKTTLLTMITGDNPKAFGQDIYLFGTRKGSGETVWEIKEKVGYFSPNMTRDFERQDSIEQMIISGFFDSVGLYIKPTDLQVKLAKEWLSLLGLSSKAAQPFRLFPAGQQRLILIARAMVKHPPLLILDEPTAGLDDESAGLFTLLINKIAEESTTAIVYVSHRDEAGLKPQFIFRLTPGHPGSTGEILNFSHQ